jgi:hypothetical protein
MNHYGETAIQGLDPAEYGDWPTYFIVTEYDKANASETGWYITEDAKKVVFARTAATTADVSTDLVISRTPVATRWFDRPAGPRFVCARRRAF